MSEAPFVIARACVMRLTQYKYFRRLSVIVFTHERLKVDVVHKVVMILINQRNLLDSQHFKLGAAIALMLVFGADDAIGAVIDQHRFAVARGQHPFAADASPRYQLLRNYLTQIRGRIGACI